MTERIDAIVALANDSGEQNVIGEETMQRMDTAVGLMRDQMAPHLVVVGGHSFMRRTSPECSIAHLMRNYAVEKGIPESQIRTQAESLDTIGDALLTKNDITEPNDWKNLVLVTSAYHLPRTQRIFDHVMGPQYTISGIAADESFHESRRLYEIAANLLARVVLHGTEAGDTETIQRHLFSIVPGYSEIPILRRLINLSAVIVTAK